MVRLSGGRDSKIQPPFMLFTKKDCIYPIRKVPDDISGVSYSFGPKGWVDTILISQMFKEHIINLLPKGRRHSFFCG